MEWLRRGWWELVTLVLAANSALFGVLGLGAENLVYALVAGFVPALLLATAVMFRRSLPGLAAASAVIGAVGASFSFWLVYPVVLGLVVMVGGFLTGKLGGSANEP